MKRVAATATLVVAVLAFVSSLVSREAAAQSSAWKRAPRRCGDVETQYEMNACFAREAARVGALLDMLLKEIRPSLDAAERKGLDAAQVQWSRYRDVHCHWVASASEGGTIQPTVQATCLADVTWERIGALKLALCEGGVGLGSPCAASHRYDRPADR